MLCSVLPKRAHQRDRFAAVGEILVRVARHRHVDAGPVIGLQRGGIAGDDQPLAGASVNPLGNAYGAVAMNSVIFTPSRLTGVALGFSSSMNSSSCSSTRGGCACGL